MGRFDSTPFLLLLLPLILVGLPRASTAGKMCNLNIRSIMECNAIEGPVVLEELGFSRRYYGNPVCR